MHASGREVSRFVVGAAMRRAGGEHGGRALGSVGSSPDVPKGVAGHDEEARPDLLLARCGRRPGASRIRIRGAGGRSFPSGCVRSVQIRHVCRLTR